MHKSNDQQKAAFDHSRDDSSGPYSTDILMLDDGQISLEKEVTVTDGEEGDSATDAASRRRRVDGK